MTLKVITYTRKGAVGGALPSFRVQSFRCPKEQMKSESDPKNPVNSLIPPPPLPCSTANIRLHFAGDSRQSPPGIRNAWRRGCERGSAENEQRRRKTQACTARPTRSSGSNHGLSLISSQRLNIYTYIWRIVCVKTLPTMHLSERAPRRREIRRRNLGFIGFGID